MAKPPHRWLLPAVVVGVSLLAFAAATRPSPQPEIEAAPTTLPPGLSEVSTELIDLTSPTGSDAMTNGWGSVGFQWPGRINDIVPYNSSLFAFGYDDEGAAAWLSGSGSGWREAPRFEDPGDPNSSVDHAVVWDGDIVALGSVGDDVGLWTARTVSHWIYRGTVAEMDGWIPLGQKAPLQVLEIFDGA